jgi:2-polyprenyl-3-methyl-5-hydroxy-6-metoxy-1,4-benzoquinol methylase
LDRILTHCRICDGTDFGPVLDLGCQPWCNDFLRADECGTEPRYPLRLVYCHGCGAAQLDYTVPKEVMFRDHTYLSGVTRTLAAHFRSVADDVDLRFFSDRPGKSALDIGSNDGTQLKQFKALGYDVLGVDSARTPAARAIEAGIPTVNEFFNLELAQQLGRRFDVINAGGVFFHLEELHSVTDGIREALAPDGVFVVQFLYMKCIVEHAAFDQIYHEHLMYYTLQSLDGVLSRHGLEAFDAYVSPVHGGSAIVFATHAGTRPVSPRLQSLRDAETLAGTNDYSRYVEFATRVAALKDESVRCLEAQRRAGRRVFGFGAPAKGNTLLNYFGLGPDTLECLVEKNALRRGLYSPGMHIPIVMEDELTDDPDLYYVLAWNFRDEILANNRAALSRGVEFHFPIRPAVAAL